MNKQIKVYVANSLFSESDIAFNISLANKIRDIDGVIAYLPQENMEINDKNKLASSAEIFLADTTELITSDVLIAVIDGNEIDSGVACEIGLFASTGKPIFALYTDSRLKGHSNNEVLDKTYEDATENQVMYRNLFVVGAIKANGIIFHSTNDLVEDLEIFVGE